MTPIASVDVACSIAPILEPVAPSTLAASPDSLAHSVPTLFFSSSNQPISCCSIALNAATRSRAVSRTPAKPNKYICRNMQSPVTTPITTNRMEYNSTSFCTSSAFGFSNTPITSPKRTAYTGKVDPTPVAARQPTTLCIHSGLLRANIRLSGVSYCSSSASRIEASLCSLLPSTTEFAENFRVSASAPVAQPFSSFFISQLPTPSVRVGSAFTNAK